MRYRMMSPTDSHYLIDWCNKNHVPYQASIQYDELVHGDGNYVEVGMTDGMWDIYDHDTQES